MPTPRRGHKTPELLLSGERDQYAVARSYGTIIIELSADDYARTRPWIVTLTRRLPGGDVSTTEHAFEKLNDARREFKRLVRKHP